MEPYLLTEEDIRNFNLKGAMVGEQATDADLEAMGRLNVEDLPPVVPSQTSQDYTAARAQGVEPENAPQSGGIPVTAPTPSPAMGAGTAGANPLMGLLAQSDPIPQDPFENLSRSQRTMIGFAALKDAGMALQGKEGGAVSGVMKDITLRADMERKRQAAVARQQMMGSLMGGGLSREAIINAMAQGLIDGPTGTAMLGEEERKKGVQQEVAGKEMMIGQIDALLFDPALSSALGIEGFLRRPLSELGLDEDAARVRGRIDQIKGGAFLQAFESLKGGGQITELEGQKAEQAQSRLNTAQSEEDFREALQEYKFYIDQGVRRLRGEQIPADTIYGGGQGGASDPLGIR